MGDFLEEIKMEPENATIIIEGAMRLHTILFDYRYEHSDPIPDDIERIIFNEDMINSSESAMVVGNGIVVSGNLSNHDREIFLKLTPPFFL